VRPFKVPVYYSNSLLRYYLNDAYGNSSSGQQEFLLHKPLLDEVVEEFVMCPQMKSSLHVFQHVPANETVLAMPANETFRTHNVT
jgi:hypothetical protein